MYIQTKIALVFAALGVVLVASCNNSIDDRIARSPQSQQDRADAAWNASLAQAHFDNTADGGASAGDPSQYGCQTRDYGDLAVRASVQSRLAGLQRQSISNGLEMCGYVLIGAGCQLRHSETTLGTSHSCNMAIPSNSTLLATYHTHGIAHGNNSGEIPSDTDFRSTISLQVDGYVATPAGRFWHIDAVSQTASVVCRNCMPVDPRSRSARRLFEVGQSYRYVDILAVMRENGLSSGGG